MIRLGRVYKGLMVDVQASNAKLARRREAIVRGLTGRSGPEVRGALARAGGSVKLAVLLLEGCDLDLAKAILDRAGGRLGAALREVPGVGDQVSGSVRRASRMKSDPRA
jgi:N-acetylmuramic acid 6-phosphate etherase